MIAFPYLTADLPGIGGTLKVSPEDFFVEEIPAYEPAGEGEHLFVTIEKRGLSTYEAVSRLARALGVPERDIGTAGLKDRFAVTRQRISLPRVGEEAVRALSIDGLRILSAARHGNKLRTGHLSGNRFVLRVRGLALPPEEASARATAVLERLARPPGMPNWYGEQRFGARGDNATRGRALVRGEAGRARDRRELRLLVSAYQSELFNRYLCARLTEGLLARVIEGDILQKVESGGIFATTDPGVDQPRLEAGEVVPTGPMFGSAMRAPADETEAARRERAVLSAEGLVPSAFAKLRFAEGTRRATAVRLLGPRAIAEGDALVLEFTLPPGAYATLVADEVMKSGGQRPPSASGPNDALS